MLGGCCGCLLLLLLLDVEERVRESLTRQGRGERKKIQSYSTCVYMHCYCSNFACNHSNFAYMQSYANSYKHRCRPILCYIVQIFAHFVFYIH